MSSECKAEVKRDEIRAAEDYRLNYRLNKACDAEIDTLCPDVCSPFSGQVPSLARANLRFAVRGSPYFASSASAFPSFRRVPHSPFRAASAGAGPVSTTCRAPSRVRAPATYPSAEGR
jgi:hypothetical protein